MHAAGAGEVERMRRGRAHGDARAHHPHARQRGGVGVDAAAGGDEVVGVRRRQAAERNVVDMILGERVPDDGRSAWSCSSIGQAVRPIASAKRVAASSRHLR